MAEREEKRREEKRRKEKVKIHFFINFKQFLLESGIVNSQFFSDAHVCFMIVSDVIRIK